VNASQSRAQQIALLLLGCPVFSYAPAEQLAASRNWAMYMLLHLSTTFTEFSSLFLYKKTVYK
jgi:hypothetical protein